MQHRAPRLSIFPKASNRHGPGRYVQLAGRTVQVGALLLLLRIVWKMGLVHLLYACCQWIIMFLSTFATGEQALPAIPRVQDYLAERSDAQAMVATRQKYFYLTKFRSLIPLQARPPSYSTWYGVTVRATRLGLRTPLDRGLNLARVHDDQTLGILRRTYQDFQQDWPRIRRFLQERRGGPGGSAGSAFETDDPSL